MTSLSYWAKVIRMFCIILPAEVDVSICCVTATSDTPQASNFAESDVKSQMERDIRSIL